MAGIIKTPIVRRESIVLNSQNYASDEKPHDDSQLMHEDPPEVVAANIDAEQHEDSDIEQFANNNNANDLSVIKNVGNEDNKTQPAPSRTDDVVHEALRVANDKIEKLKNEVENYKGNIEDIENIAEKDAYEKGHKEGVDAAGIEFSDKLALLTNVIDKLTSKCEQNLENTEDDIVEIVYAAVCKITGQFSINPESIIPLVKKLIASVISDSQSINVHVSLKDYEVLSALQSEINDNGMPYSINFTSDDRVKNGGCIIESSNGNIDARLDVQLRKFKEVLEDARRFKPESHGT